MQVSYYKTVKNHSEKNISIKEVIDIIKKDKLLKTAIEKIRAEPEKEKRNKLKRNLLPAITLSGTFANGTHKIKDFQEHSGLMQIDIDNIPIEKIPEYKSKLTKDKYTFCCFLSPSGSLKTIVKVDATKETHLQTFNSLEKYYKEQGIIIDTQTKDISRLMYLSYDPDIFVNENSETYKEKLSTKPKTVKAQNTQVFINDNRADVEKVITQIESRKIDITGNYNQWITIAYAFADEFGKSGLDYFHRVSKFHPKYAHSETEKQFTHCLKHKKGSGISPFFALSRQYGLNTISVKNKDKLNTSSTNNQEPNEKHDLFAPIPLNSKDKRKDFNKYGFYKQEGAYWVFDQRTPIRISNFLMQGLYNLNNGTNDSKRIIKLQKRTGKTTIIEAYSSETSKQKFTTILRTHQCSLKGTAMNFDDIFEYLMDNELSATEITTLGHQSDTNIYAMADAIITNNKVKKINQFGIIEENDNCYYLPAFALTNKENDIYENERLLKYRQGNTDFTTWANLFYKAYGINGGIGIMYTILSIYRDLIFKHNNYFPFMFLFGKEGTGKTSFVNCITKVFGNFEGTDLNQTTSTGFSRTVSQRINSIFYFKEFTPQTHSDIHNFILTGYDGVGRTMGQKTVGNQTKSLKTQSGIIFDGNYLPIQKMAVYSRLIVLIFEEQIFSAEATKAHKELKERIQLGLGLVLKEILEHRQLFETKFKEVYSTTVELIKKNYKLQHLPDRLKNHLALLVTPYKILYGKLNFPFSLKDLQEKLIEYAQDQQNVLNENKDVAIFWDALNYTKQNEPHLFRKDEHYYIEEIKETNEGFVYLLYKFAYPAYVRYCKNNNFNIADKETLRTLLTSQGYKPFQPGKTQKQTLKNRKRCYKFRYEIIDGISILDNQPMDLW